MTYIAKDEKKEYPRVEEGQHVGRCIDFIGPWEAVDDFDPAKPYPIQKVAYVWHLDQTRDDGKPFEVAREFSKTFGKKANLRKFLGGWRGKEIGDAEAKAGVDIDLKGRDALLMIEHKEKRAGGIRVEVSMAMPLPKVMTPLGVQPYTRAPYWAKRIEEDTAKSRALHERLQEVRATEARNAADFSDAPAGLDADQEDDLPF